MDFYSPNESWPKEAVKIYYDLKKLTEDGKWVKQYWTFPKENDLKRNFYTSAGNRCFSGAVFSNLEERICKGVITFQEWTEGGGKNVHGGAIATIFDMFLGDLLDHMYPRWCLTKSLKVEFKRPIPLFTPVLVEGKIDIIDGRTIYLSGCLKHVSEDKIYDKCSAVFVYVPSSKL